MKRIAIGLAATWVFTCGLSGCASLGSTSASTSTSVGNNAYEVDYAKVDSIERVSRQYGIKVVWVNQPLKKVAAPGS